MESCSSFVHFLDPDFSTISTRAILLMFELTEFYSSFERKYNLLITSVIVQFFLANDNK